MRWLCECERTNAADTTSCWFCEAVRAVSAEDSLRTRLAAAEEVVAAVRAYGVARRSGDSWGYEQDAAHDAVAVWADRLGGER